LHKNTANDSKERKTRERERERKFVCYRNNRSMDIIMEENDDDKNKTSKLQMKNKKMRKFQNEDASDISSVMKSHKFRISRLDFEYFNI